MKMLSKLVLASALTLAVLANAGLIHADFKIGSLSDLKEITYTEETKISPVVKTETKTETIAPKQEVKTVTPEVAEGPKGDILSKGQCGSVNGAAIYDFDNGGDSLNASSRGLCNIGALPQSFTFNTINHTRNRVCSAKGQKVSSLCKAQELFCGDGILDTTPVNMLISKNPVTNKTGNTSSEHASMSSNGRYVVFTSYARTLVPDDTNLRPDIFLYDRIAKTMKNITFGGNGPSYYPTISADGSYMAFISYATNLVEGDSQEAKNDIFMYNTSSSTMENITKGSNGADENPFISADGRYVTFNSSATNLIAGDVEDTNNSQDVFVYDRLTSKTKRLTYGDAASYASSISSDGRYISFYSAATNLVANDTNGKSDVFVYDTQTSTTKNITPTGNNGSYVNSISANGRYISFYSAATNLVANDTNGQIDVFVYDTLKNTMINITPQGNSYSAFNYISANGNKVAYRSTASNLVADDNNGFEDVFVYDMDTKKTKKISNTVHTSFGQNLGISADGYYVAFSDNVPVPPADGFGHYGQVFVNAPSLEQCDDGNNSNLDGCSVQCTIVPLP